MSRFASAATWYRWLAAVIAASARRVRVTDPTPAAVLAAAGELPVGALARGRHADLGHAA